MKYYTETERKEHIENWKTGGLSKASYAKAAGIHPTTFYNWLRFKTGKTKPGFIEIKNRCPSVSTGEIIIEKGAITIRLPLSAETEELQSIFRALEGTV